MGPAFETSEDRVEFPTGAVRSSDANGVAYHLLPQVGLRRAAEAFAHGEKKYGRGNWLRGIESSNHLNHALRHINDYIDRGGNGEEDDLGHAIADLMMVAHNEERRPDMHDVESLRQDRSPAPKGPSMTPEIRGKWMLRSIDPGIPTAWFPPGSPSYALCERARLGGIQVRRHGSGQWWWELPSGTWGSWYEDTPEGLLACYRDAAREMGLGVPTETVAAEEPSFGARCSTALARAGISFDNFVVGNGGARFHEMPEGGWYWVYEQPPRSSDVLVREWRGERRQTARACDIQDALIREKLWTPSDLGHDFAAKPESRARLAEDVTSDRETVRSAAVQAMMYFSSLDTLTPGARTCRDALESALAPESRPSPGPMGSGVSDDCERCGIDHIRDECPNRPAEVSG